MRTTAEMESGLVEDLSAIVDGRIFWYPNYQLDMFLLLRSILFSVQTKELGTSINHIVFK